MNSFDRATGAIQWTRDVLEGSPDGAARVRLLEQPRRLQEHRHHDRRRRRARRRRLRRRHRQDGVAVAGFQNGYSSPIVIDLDGRPELIVFTYGEIAGLNPDTGALEWSRPHKSDQGVNVATPIWGDDHLLFISSAYGGGSRVLKLARDAAAPCRSRKCGRTSGSGFTSATPCASAAASTPRTATWDPRRSPRSTSRPARCYGGIAASRGRRSSAPATSSCSSTRTAISRWPRPGDDGLELHGKVQLLKERAWTAPTLSGTTLFVRDRHQIMALDLGK